MYPLVGFAFQAQGYVSKGRRFLSDAPFGGFTESLARRLPLEAAHALLSLYPFGVREGLGWILACWDLRGWNLAF